MLELEGQIDTKKKYRSNRIREESARVRVRSIQRRQIYKIELEYRVLELEGRIDTKKTDKIELE